MRVWSCGKGGGSTIRKNMTTHIKEDKIMMQKEQNNDQQHEDDKEKATIKMRWQSTTQAND